MSLTNWKPRFPEMRQEAQYAVAAFADESFQNRVWLAGEAPADRYAYDFDIASHVLLDDLDLLNTPERLIDSVLRDAREAADLRALAEALSEVIDEIGPKGRIDEALRASAWPTVVAKAKVALATLGPPTEFP